MESENDEVNFNFICWSLKSFRSDSQQKYSDIGEKRDGWEISRILPCQLQSVCEFNFVRTSGRGEHRELYIILLVNLARVFFKTLIKVQLSLTQRNVNFQDGISRVAYRYILYHQDYLPYPPNAGINEIRYWTSRNLFVVPLLSFRSVKICGLISPHIDFRNRSFVYQVRTCSWRMRGIVASNRQQEELSQPERLGREKELKE